MSQSSQDNGSEQVILFEAYCIASIKNYYKNYLVWFQGKKQPSINCVWQ